MISIIIPIYKVEEFLDKCVSSIVNQTYKNLEIILVDDGSPDNCPAMCDRWAEKDARIKVIHKENGGLSSARNAGIKAAKGDYIGFIDSDDWAEKDMYERLLMAFHNHPNIGVTGCMLYSWTDGVIKPYKKEWVIKRSRIITSNYFGLVMMTQKACHTVYNKLYKSSLVKQVLFREGHNNEDTLYMYDLAKVLKRENLDLLEIPEFLYYYRQRADSITTSRKKPLGIDIIANYIDLMQDCHGKDQKLFKAIYKMYVTVLYHFLDTMLLNNVWRQNYFGKYQALLKQVPNSYIRHHFPKNDILYIEMLKYTPSLRKAIRLALNLIRKQ